MWCCSIYLRGFKTNCLRGEIDLDEWHSLIIISPIEDADVG